MRIQKRVVMLLVLVLLVLSSVSVLAEDEDKRPQLTLSENKYYSGRLCSDHDQAHILPTDVNYDCDDYDVPDDGQGDLSKGLPGLSWAQPGQSFPKCAGGSNSACQFSRQPSDVGCWIQGTERSFVEECSWVKIKEGTQIAAGEKVDSWVQLSIHDFNKQPFNPKNGNRLASAYWDYSDNSKGFGFTTPTNVGHLTNTAAMCQISDYNFFNSNGAMICSGDHFWHECKEDNLNGVTWANDNVYRCELTDKRNKVYNWVNKGVDKDQDTYSVKEGDTKDDPSADPLFCPTDFSECTGKSRIKYATCAICQNPGTIEICGDGIDNNLNGDGDESCDINKNACEQDGALNVFNQKFSHIKTQTKTGGACCGVNGLKDLGRIESTNDGDYVCLNKNLVKGEKKALSVFKSQAKAADPKEGSSKQKCEGDWCWVQAVGDAKFKILTVKEPGKTSYDLVSNGQEWQQCSINSPNSTLKTPSNEKAIANRFYCYQEGDHYAWAECAGKTTPHFNIGAKARFEGDGVYRLPLQKGEEPQKARVGKSIEIKASDYELYYGKNHLFDFTRYDTLHVMVQFVNGESPDDPEKIIKLKQEELLFPLDVNLKINGPKQQDKSIPTYFDAPILGHAVNSPFFEQDSNFIHLEVPIPQGLKAISSLEFTSIPAKHAIVIRNVYLSNSNNNVLCSGIDSESEQNWISSADDGRVRSEINGEKICKALYGDNAWLGNDQVVNNQNFPNNNCCGNSKGEYYSSKSSPNKDGAYYGCWNSQPVNSGTDLMDIDFQLDYSVRTKNIDTSYNFALPKLDLNYVFRTAVDMTNQYCKDSEGSAGATPRSVDASCLPGSCVGADGKCHSSDSHLNDGTWYCFDEKWSYCTEHTQGKKHCNGGFFECSTDQPNSVNPKPRWLFDSSTGKKGSDRPSQDGKAKEVLESISCSQGTTLTEKDEFKVLCEIDVDSLQKKHTLSGKHFATIDDLWVSALDNEYFELSFVDLTTNQKFGKEVKSRKNTYTKGEYLSKPAILLPGKTLEKLNGRTLALVVSKRQGANLPVKVQPAPLQKRTESLSFPCSKSECIFPLKGEAPYTITNPYPELYELYFINGTEKEDEYLITANTKFEGEGNLKVKRVSNQILFYNEGDNAEIDSGFYGCQAANFLTARVSQIKQKSYCSSINEFFCSHDNTWSDETISYVGYERIANPKDQTVEEFYKQTRLELREATDEEKKSQRNHTAIALPTRNVLSNALFETKGQDILHWELSKNGVGITDEKQFLKDDKLTIKLEADVLLRSPRIPLNHSTEFYFAQSSSLKPTITLVDKDGKTTKVTSLEKFNTQTSSYLTIEFKGPGEILKPTLQVLDSLGPIENFSYNTQIPTPLKNNNQRSPVACCPQNYCWNGYSCVAPMEEKTSLAEYAQDGRTYRCVEGQWTHTPVRWDWNGKDWGFCSTQTQCFVLADGKKDNTAQTAYQGNFPNCVEKDEYIFDHMCGSEGNWTTRTKLLATQMLNSVQRNDFTLHCENYKEALPGTDYKNVENFLGGSQSTTEKKKQDIGGAVSKDNTKPTLLRTCFPNIKSDNSLVPQADNTCINNACVLQIGKGDKTTTTFATTLNKALDDPKDAFLGSIGIPLSQIKTICSNAKPNEFTKCDLSKTSLPSSATLYYSKDLNAIIYSKEGVKLTPGFVDNVVNWFKKFFTGATLTSGQSYVAKAQNANVFYLRRSNNTAIKALKEVKPGQVQLEAEYTNFKTSVCDYTANRKVPESAKGTIFDQLEGKVPIECTRNGDTQVVKSKKAADFLWPELTKKLR